ncbi:palmitoyltransferase [Serendipita sp. 396]|nr:palmitoyltransferase [Serendipita sp. 396]KAG8776545.1 palmitoyltransferase [Serendipita sp. 397]KAG8863588.1 palmitoyltransferase [Serendipita sp. 405]
MKVFQLSVLQIVDGTATTLTSASDLSSFSFYQRGSVGEFMGFMTKTVAERTADGQRQSVQENSYFAHVYNSGQENLAAVVITDEEYPVRPAFSLLQKVIDDFLTSVPKASYSNPSSIDFPAARAYLAQYQDPKAADQIMRVQAELDETKIVLHKTIEGVLQRGENLDNLVERSNALSAQSKMFYKTAKQQNSCCVIT